jgi:carbonic anhydrase
MRESSMNIDRLVENNAHFVGSFDSGSLKAPPAKPVIILTCIDARVDPARILGLEIGDANVVRNAGGLATDDALRSIAISQHLLGTTEVMVLHHTDCGMAMFDDDEVAATIEERTGERPTMALGAFTDADQSVRDAVAAVVACGYLNVRDQVRGFVYEKESGRVREVR